MITNALTNTKKASSTAHRSKSFVKCAALDNAIKSKVKTFKSKMADAFSKTHDQIDKDTTVDEVTQRLENFEIIADETATPLGESEAKPVDYMTLHPTRLSQKIRTYITSLVRGPVPATPEPSVGVPAPAPDQLQATLAFSPGTFGAVPATPPRASARHHTPPRAPKPKRRRGLVYRFDELAAVATPPLPIAGQVRRRADDEDELEQLGAPLAQRTRLEKVDSDSEPEVHEYDVSALAISAAEFEMIEANKADDHAPSHGGDDESEDIALRFDHLAVPSRAAEADAAFEARDDLYQEVFGDEDGYDPDEDDAKQKDEMARLCARLSKRALSADDVEHDEPTPSELARKAEREASTRRARISAAPYIKSQERRPRNKKSGGM